jgi:hypothetical protein
VLAFEGINLACFGVKMQMKESSKFLERNERTNIFFTRNEVQQLVAVIHEPYAANFVFEMKT